MDRRIYLSDYQIKQGITKIAHQINKQYSESDELCVVCILKGGFIFCADLVRQLHCQVKIEFVQVSSYVLNQHTKLMLKSPIHEFTAVKNKHVLIIDDINDSGKTLEFLTNLCKEFQASLIQSAVILQSNKSCLIADYYIHVKTDEEWVYGYGMDNNDLYRNIPEIVC